MFVLSAQNQISMAVSTLELSWASSSLVQERVPFAFWSLCRGILQPISRCGSSIFPAPLPSFFSSSHLALSFQSLMCAQHTGQNTGREDPRTGHSVPLSLQIPPMPLLVASTLGSSWPYPLETEVRTCHPSTNCLPGSWCQKKSQCPGCDLQDCCLQEVSLGLCLGPPPSLQTGFPRKPQASFPL